MKKFLLSMLGVLIALPGIARDFTYEYEGQTLTYTVIDEEAKTCKTKDGNENTGSSGNNVSGELVIPSVAKDGDSEYTVTSIGIAAFYYCPGLTSVIIPNSVNSIGNDAFCNCRGLTSVIIPNSVNSIGGGAFYNCSDLKKSAFPSGLDNPFRYGVRIQYPREGAIIEDGFVYGPEKSSIYFAPLSLEGEYVIPESVSSIGDNAFYECSGLTSVTIGNSVNSIGDNAFSECSGLTSVTIGNSVNSIGDNAFSVCSGLKKSAYPSGLRNPFSYGTVIQYPSEGAIIEDGFIYGPEKKAIYFAPLSFEGEYVIPESVSSIGEKAFSGCSGLTSVTIPNSVNSIGNSAFEGCSGLTSVTIPNSVNSIGNSAFEGCSGLKTFTIEDGQSLIAFGGNALYQVPIEHLYIGRSWSYSGSYAISTGITSVEIGNSVTQLPDYAFYECSGLTSVTIPNSVNSIGNSAFEGCSGLTSISIGNSVNSIGNNAFYKCSGLTSVTIPNSVNSIGWTAFSDCSGLTSIFIGNSVNSIGDYAFSDCSGLTSVIIPNSVNSIGDNAFNYCSGLKKSAYPSGLDDLFSYGVRIQYPREGAIIEDGFVYGPEKSAIYFAPLSLEGEYVIPESVSSIGEKAFSGCSGLTSVIIPNSVNSIGYHAFYECFGLKKSAYPSGFNDPFRYGVSIQYPREGAIIEDGFVYGPEKSAIYFAPHSLEGEYVIPESVSSIGEKAFSGCSGLTSVTIPNSVTSIGRNAFYECSGLTSVKATAINPPVMNDNSFRGLYDSAALFVPVEAATDYLATNWSLFKNLRMGDSETACQTYETGNLKYMLLPGKTKDDQNFAVVIQGDYSLLTEVTIPERFAVSENGTNVRYFVDGIGFNAFNGCSNLATVTFNSRNAATSIGDYAFAGTKIAALSIPATVETIGNHAFDSCQSLTSIAIPTSVKTIGNYAFNSCTALTEITVPGSVESVGNYAFNSCTALSKANLEAGVRKIGDYAFNSCTALSKANLEAGVRKIGDFAFYDTSSLKEITLNEGLESIGEKCFSASRDRDIEPVYIPSTLKSVGADAYMNFNCRYVNISDLATWCNIDFADAFSNPAKGTSLYLNGEKIEDLVIPESVDVISGYAFYDNNALKSVKFNDTLQSIGESAFDKCSGLAAVVIPRNVTTIGNYAFRSGNIKNVTFAYGANPITIGSYAFPAPISLSWDRPVESMNLKVNSLESLTIGNSLTEIPAAKFKGASKLTSLTLGNSLTAIGDEAFSGCTALTEVILPPSVETIGASAFAGNSKLTSIIMGHNVKTIGKKAYDLCPAQTVSITAQTPPEALDNTFSNYTGKLYVQGETAAEAYYDADYCWYQFEGHVMIEPTELKVEGDKTLNGKPGDTFQLTATLYPTDVTLPQIFWRSTNPDIATVDANGLVTLHADMSEVMAMAEGDDDTTGRSCKIVAESLYANGPVAEFTINDVTTGINDIINDSTPSGDIDFSAPVQVYNLQGVMVGDNVENLSSGFYIVRHGNNVRKIAVK